MTTLTIEWSDKVAHVQLSRPDSLNALSGEMIEGLVAVGRDLAGRRDCRAVVLSGAGRAFCSGIDLNALRAVSSGGGATIDLRTEVENGANIAQLAVLQWQSLPMPVIAAVHGFALGGGLQLALGADMRIVAPDTRLGFIEVKWGIVPDMGGMALLPGLVRPDIMANLLFTGRIFGGEEAVRIGIATEAADNPFEAAMDLARVIASASPDAVRAAKRLMRVRGDTSSILRAETREGTLLLGGPNQREAMAAGLGKRPGVYAD
jgi:enoyl-CoA hydratase/carnithine racemase